MIQLSSVWSCCGRNTKLTAGCFAYLIFQCSKSRGMLFDLRLPLLQNGERTNDESHARRLYVHTGARIVKGWLGGPLWFGICGPKSSAKIGTVDSGREHLRMRIKDTAKR